jgi:hypothetical protein
MNYFDEANLFDDAAKLLLDKTTKKINDMLEKSNSSQSNMIKSLDPFLRDYSISLLALAAIKESAENSKLAKHHQSTKNLISACEKEMDRTILQLCSKHSGAMLAKVSTNLLKVLAETK